MHLLNDQTLCVLGGNSFGIRRLKGPDFGPRVGGIEPGRKLVGKQKANALKCTMQIPSELAWAHPVTAEWFVRKFGTPTEPQVEGWL
jgi:hypothetical protein